MTTRALYRVAAVLIFLFNLGHTANCPWSDPTWGVDLGAVQSSRFNVLGFSRTYWDFYVGFGLSESVFLLLAAVLAWQLGGMPAGTLGPMRVVSWAFALSFAVVTILNWVYFFTIPITFSLLITICLTAAAWRSR